MTFAPRNGYWRWPKTVPFRQGGRFGDLILVGGQNAMDGLGTVLSPGDRIAQAETAMRSIAQVIEDLGGRADNLAKLTVFYVYGGAEAERDLMRCIRRLCPGTPPPALTMVPLPRLALPGLAITIDAVAIAPSAGSKPRPATMPADHWQWPSGAEFSHGLRCGERVFISGQMARHAGVDAAAGTIVDQARMTIDNVSKVLRQLDCDLDDVVKLNTWYTGDGTDADWRKAAEIRGNAFRFPGPGATGVPIPGPYPGGVMLRQECMALRAASGDRLPRSLSWPLGHWDWPIPVSFQQGLKIGKLIVLGGQISTDVYCKAVDPGNMRAQARNVMEAIRSILAGFGTGLDSVIKLTCFYKTRGDQRDLTDMLDVVSAYYEEPAPPITIVPLENLGFEDVTLEIEGLALADR